MEDVLDLYAEPYDPRYPQVCFDEHPVQLLGDVLVPIPLRPGHPRRYDHEYERKGVISRAIMYQRQSPGVYQRCAAGVYQRVWCDS